MAVTDWSTTADDNTTLGSIALGENVMLVADVNDAFREMMAQIAGALGVSIQQYDAGVASIAGLTTAADRMIYTTASDTYAVATLTSFARTLLDDADASTARATLGAGTLDNVVEDTSPQLGGSLDAQGQNITDLADVTFRTGASGGTLRTGTSAADKFVLQAYDVDGSAYVTLLEADAGNTPILQLFTSYLEIEDDADPTKQLGIDLSGATTGTRVDLIFSATANRNITFPDVTGTLLSDDDILDEDDMSSDSATDVASQQSIKAYVDANAAFQNALLHVRDEKSSTTEGGTFTSGAWRTRDLNTVVTNQITGASLSSNQITLPAGTYLCIASAPAQAVNRHQTRLYNVTDTAVIEVGTSSYTNTADIVQTRSEVRSRFTLAASKTIELQHQANVTKATDGFGVANDFTTEVYSDVMIWKVG